MQNRRLALLALAAGLVAGSIVAAYPMELLRDVVAWIEPVGRLWINALRMVVVPLVVAMLVSGVATVSDGRTVRRLGITSLAVWVGLLLVSAVLGLTLVPLLFSGLSLDPAATAALRESAAGMAGATSEGLQRMPGIAEWIVTLVPVNPVRAAADGAMLPLVVFSLLFGLAVGRLPEPRRDAIAGLAGTVAEAMLVMVRWVLAAAPVGVFALSLGMASRLGVEAAGALGYYLVATAVSMAALVAVLFVLTVLVARVPPLTLARALLPPQVVGFTSRSSLASLPAQAEAAARQLHVPPGVVGFVLPLAVSSFKPHGPVNWSSLAIFSALLYGVPLGPADVLTVVVSAVLLSFAVPGIPSAGMLLIAPVFASVGVPVEAIGVLIAVDAIPDMFKTVANVTGQLASVAIVARLAGRGAESADVELDAGGVGAAARLQANRV